MAIGSIVLGIAAFLFMVAGIIFTVVPFAGSLFSFGAPLLALAGIVTGGIALSRARAEGQPTGAGLAGLIVSIIAFLCSLVVAVTCGMCNLLCSGGMMNARPGHYLFGDAGPSIGPLQPPTPLAPPGTDPMFGKLDAGSGPGVGPPPAFPPPPLPPGPPGSAQPAPAPSPAPVPAPSPQPGAPATP